QVLGRRLDVDTLEPRDRLGGDEAVARDVPARLAEREPDQGGLPRRAGLLEVERAEEPRQLRRRRVGVADDVRQDRGRALGARPPDDVALALVADQPLLTEVVAKTLVPVLVRTNPERFEIPAV